MKRFVLVGVATAAVALFGWVAPVQATPITYTETATASGALDGHSFTNALVTITFLGDTSNVVPFGNGCGPCLVNVSLGHSVTVNVAGVGTDTFTDSIGIIDFPFLSPDLGGMAGVAWVDAAPQTNGILLVPTITNVFLGYDLGPIGPVSGSGQTPPGGPSGASYSTTLGTFQWTYPATSTFTARVPEPATLTLTALGLAGVVLRYRRRRSAS